VWKNIESYNRLPMSFHFNFTRLIMNSLFQLEIPKRQTHCSHQRERLLPGMEIYSQLSENEKEGFDRHDFCSSCWTDLQEKSQKVNSQIYWKSKIEPRKKHRESSRFSRALTLLREMQNASEPQEGEMFVLCLFLSRARQIALRQEFQKEDLTYQVYEILQEEEFFTVKSLKLSTLQIEMIQKSLAIQLQ
jgi:hypothetical protein